jgi:uncharacterized protein
VKLFLIIYAAMIVVAALLATVTGCPSLFRLPESRTVLGVSLGVAVASALGVVQLGVLLEAVPWYRRMGEKIREMTTGLLGPRLDPQKAFVIALYSSVGEEALFRGFLQPFLIMKLEGPLDGPGAAPTVLGILATVVLFAVLHPPLMPELRPWTVFALVVGLLFGVLAAWSQSLAAPVVAHFLINWLNLHRLDKLRPAAGPT